MREIKFRAWDKNRMWSWEQLVQRNCAIRFFFFVPDLLELMQYTGLKDKNGKEIYEGDIVQWWNGITKPEVVEATDGGWNPFIDSCETDGSWHYKVIGNIYAHKELLECKTELCPKCEADVKVWEGVFANDLDNGKHVCFNKDTENTSVKENNES